MQKKLNELRSIIDTLELEEDKKEQLDTLYKSIDKHYNKLTFQIESYKENTKSSKLLLNNIISEINEKNSQFQNTIDNLQDVYYRIDFEGNLLQASPSICDRLGYNSLDEIIGKNVVKMFSRNPDSTKTFLNEIKKNGKVLNYAVEFINKDGVIIHGELNCVLCYDKDGKPFAIEGIVHDVSERVESERELKLLNEELQNSLDNIEEQKAQIENQHEILINQTELVTYQQDQLKKSITYAQRIQQSILSDTNILENHFFEHFIFYKASSIISGDFYFFQQIDNFAIIAIADCTGHGVPGGFMTMLGITLIDEIIRRKDVNSPVTALNLLRENVIRSLKQEVSSEVKDGLDIAMCAINLDTLELEYAGSNIPLFIYKNYKDFEKDVYGSQDKIIIEDQLIEIKPDRIPIGFYYLDKPFSKCRVQLKRGDKIYMSTDGYPDQFGGKRGRKYLAKNFKKLILEHQHLNMLDQKEAFTKKHLEWRGEYEQIDDILVFGLTI